MKEKGHRVITGASLRERLMRTYHSKKKTPLERSIKRKKQALRRIEEKSTKDVDRRDVVDKQGNPLKLSAYQRRVLLSKARSLKRRIADALVSKSQLWAPTRHNIHILDKREHGIDLLKQQYVDIMEALGASEEDMSVEHFRKGRR